MFTHRLVVSSRLLRLNLGLVAGAALSLAVVAQAALPPSLDRVAPGDDIVVTIPNVARLGDGLEVFMASLGIDRGALPMPFDLWNMEGMNAQGSMSISIKQGRFGEDEFVDDSVIILMPITDYAAFVTGLGGEVKPLSEVFMEGESLYARDAGGGYAVLGNDRARVEAYKAEGGNMAAHRQALGATGSKVAETSRVFFTFNVEAMRETLDEMVDGFQQQADMVQMMGGVDLGGMLGVIEGVVQALSRDGETLTIGLDPSEAGLTFGLAAHFKPGSPTAAMMSADGKASSLVGKLPSHPFLGVLAMDFSAPPIAQMIAAAAKDAQAGVGAMFGGLNLEQMAKASDGQAILFGTPPGVSGGMLFINTLAYYPSKDPAAFVRMTKEIVGAMNGQTAEGVTYATTFNTDSATIAGTKVSDWSIRMRFDPDSPEAAQAKQMMDLIFGAAAGPSGYTAAVPGGAIMTMARNSALMDAAIQASKGTGPNIGADPSIRAVASRLPEGRVIEGYVGTRAAMELAMDLGALLGGFFEMELPEEVPPIGMGMSMRQGGLHLGIVAPMGAVKSIGEMIQNVMGMMGGFNDFDAMDDAPPPPPGRF